jgi:hypothetical protein
MPIEGSYLGDPLWVILTLTNLRGVAYRVTKDNLCWELHRVRRVIRQNPASAASQRPESHSPSIEV